MTEQEKPDKGFEARYYFTSAIEKVNSDELPVKILPELRAMKNEN